MEIDNTAHIAKSAVIAGRVKIGANVIINEYAIINGNIEISDNATINSHAVIKGNVKIDSNVYIGEHSVINSQTHVAHFVESNGTQNLDSKNTESNKSQNLDSKNHNKDASLTLSMTTNDAESKNTDSKENIESNTTDSKNTESNKSQNLDSTQTQNQITIGANTYIYNNVSILGNTQIGKNNKIFPNASLGSPPQDLKYQGEKTLLKIGDNNLIRESCMFNPGTLGGGGITQIGDNNLFMAFVHIAHDCIIGDNNILANNATLGGHIVLENHINIGGMTPIHQFVKIGEGAMIAGASALSQDIPPYCMAEGNRAKIIGLNRFRMRKIMSREEIDSIDSLYKRLFSGEKPLRDIAESELKDEKNNKYITKICEFILESTRGIPYKRGEND